MATPGELVKVTALALGKSEPTVTQHDRNLVIAGLRTKGGRGTSAAKVTARDAAHLITAVMGSEEVQDSVNTVLRYTDSVEHSHFYSQAHPAEYLEQARRKYAAFGQPTLEALVEGHSFIDALTALVTLAMDETFDREIGVDPVNCQIHVSRPHTHARIHIWSERPNKLSVQADYQRFTGWKGGRRAKDPPEQRGPMSVSALIYSTPIRIIGAALGGRRLKNVDKL